MKYRRFANPFHPGEILLEEFLKPMELSQRALSKKLNWPPRKINEIIRGKRGISASAAIDLSQVFDTTPEFWLTLQQTWDLDQAYRVKDAS